MSNCVFIRSTIVLSKQHIDSERLFADIKRINKDKKVKIEGPLDEFIIWWFLGEGNVQDVGDEIEIDLGAHRSAHTWRDLRQTIHVLASYRREQPAGKAVWIQFDAQDEFSDRVGEYKAPLVTFDEGLELYIRKETVGE